MVGVYDCKVGRVIMWNDWLNERWWNDCLNEWLWNHRLSGFECWRFRLFDMRAACRFRGEGFRGSFKLSLDADQFIDYVVENRVLECNFGHLDRLR